MTVTFEEFSLTRDFFDYKPSGEADFLITYEASISADIRKRNDDMLQGKF